MPPLPQSDNLVSDAVSTFDESLEAIIGDPNPDFIDTQEFIGGGRESSCGEFASSSEEEDDHDERQLRP